MIPSINIINKINNKISTINLLSNTKLLPKIVDDKKEIDYIKSKIKDNQSVIIIEKFDKKEIFILIDSIKLDYLKSEKIRTCGFEIFNYLKKNKISEVNIVNFTIYEKILLSFLEGIIFSAYEFDKYLTKKTEFKKLKIYLKSGINKKEIDEIVAIAEGVEITKDLINEPLSAVNSITLAEAAKNINKNSALKVKVLNKEEIVKLKMGGLLAVNMGSIDPPTFTILEWKPKSCINKKPIIFVGKGIVFDTGGLSLKPTTDSMDYMKTDMSGAAAVIGLFHIISKLQLGIHCIGLIPATDNRPDGNAITPGEVITMYDKTTVEVMNTDAEGRLILADALSFAKQYNPELVFDIATLTGAAAMAIGQFGVLAMGKTKESYFKMLKESGNNTYNRIVELPLWDEYKKLLESDIADMKNVGGKYAGSITAGKFLEHFVDYNWIHLDIAGSAFIKKKDSYRGKGPTAVGVRLFYDFLKNYNEKYSKN